MSNSYTTVSTKPDVPVSDFKAFLVDEEPPAEPIISPKKNSANFSSDLAVDSLMEKAEKFSRKANYLFHKLCETCRKSFLHKILAEKKGSQPRLMPELAENFSIGSEKLEPNSIEDTKMLSRTRKMDRDCVLKKIKCRLFKYVKNKLKELMQEQYTMLRIPPNVICDATYKYNYKLVNSQVRDIFIEKNIYFGTDQQISALARPGKDVQLIHFLSMKIKKAFEEYLRSESFESDLKKFKKDNYFEVYKKYCYGFVEYYKRPIENVNNKFAIFID